MANVKISDIILFSLEKSLDGFLKLTDMAYNPGIYAYHGGRELKKSEFTAALARLRKKGFIEKSHNENELIIKLTEAGKDWVFKHKELSEDSWDGLWRIVIFDIPESHKRIRNILRRRLKEWGFKVWQKSVWATKKPLTKEIQSLVKELKVEDWVLVFESSNTGKV